MGKLKFTEVTLIDSANGFNMLKALLSWWFALKVYILSVDDTSLVIVV